MNLPTSAAIVEVGPRDGFQMEKVFIPTGFKVKIIDAIALSGVRKIEATSFVSPKTIAQMADAEEVMRRIRRVPGVAYTALVPNLKGAERAAAAGVNGIRIVVCATETYNFYNVRRTVEESLRECESVLTLAARASLPAEAILSLCFGCPLEGDVPAQRVLGLASRLAAMGFQEISIADSVGVANPVEVRRRMRMLMNELPSVRFSMHFHDTRGLGLANVLAALAEGVTVFDSSIGGLGGCPVVAGGTGNVASEDLVHMLAEMGLETGVDLEALLRCSREIQEFLGRALPSRVLQAGTRAQLFQRHAPPQQASCEDAGEFDDQAGTAKSV